MTCYCCAGETKKFGSFRNRYGIVRRFKCLRCGKSFSEKQQFDGLRTDKPKIVQIVKLLVEGVGVNATARLTSCHVHTVLSVLETIGGKCAALLDKKVRNLAVDSLQLDELWAFVGCKQRNSGGDSARGDQYTYLAVEARTKLIVSHYTGKRDYASTDCFVADLAERVVGNVQITCDGFVAYPDAIRSHLLGRLHLAVMQKLYREDSNPLNPARRYSPGEVIGIRVETHAGAPNIDKIGTSYVERANLTVRTFNRRFTRLTLGYSKKLANHRHSVALFIAAYNFCKVHKTLGTTPAVGSKLTDHVWTVEELVEEATKC
jgi:IS1 family transposase/transposase-like protein